MSRSIYRYVVEGLKKDDVERAHVATKVPVSTLRKIRDGHIKNPGVKGMEKLYFFFRDQEQRQKAA